MILNNMPKFILNLFNNPSTQKKACEKLPTQKVCEKPPLLGNGPYKTNEIRLPPNVSNSNTPTNVGIKKIMDFIQLSNEDIKNKIWSGEFDPNQDIEEKSPIHHLIDQIIRDPKDSQSANKLIILLNSGAIIKNTQALQKSLNSNADVLGATDGKRADLFKNIAETIGKANRNTMNACNRILSNLLNIAGEATSNFDNLLFWGHIIDAQKTLNVDESILKQLVQSQKVNRAIIMGVSEAKLLALFQKSLSEKNAFVIINTIGVQTHSISTVIRNCENGRFEVTVCNRGNRNRLKYPDQYITYTSNDIGKVLNVIHAVRNSEVTKLTIDAVYEKFETLGDHVSNPDYPAIQDQKSGNCGTANTLAAIKYVHYKSGGDIAVKQYFKPIKNQIFNIFLPKLPESTKNDIGLFIKQKGDRSQFQNNIKTFVQSQSEMTNDERKMAIESLTTELNGICRNGQSKINISRLATLLFSTLSKLPVESQPHDTIRSLSDLANRNHQRGQTPE